VAATVGRDGLIREYHAIIQCEYNVSFALICGFKRPRNSSQSSSLSATDKAKVPIDGIPALNERMPFTDRPVAAINTRILDA
jgi:hypothetical protein